MNKLKRATTMVGVIALMASSLLVSGGMAQGIGTTIQVDNTPACVGSPSTISLTQNVNDPITFGTTGLTGSTGGNFSNKISSNNLAINMNIDECLGLAWRVDAALTDFSSESNTVVAAGKTRLFIKATTAAPGRPARPSGNNTPIVGTVTGVPHSNNDNLFVGVYFVSTGANRSVASTVSSGTNTVSGPLVQNMRMALQNVPNSTPPGTYTAEMTVTLIFAP